MNKANLFNLTGELPENDSCLDWLKNQLYPDGITCPKCRMVTGHHKLSRRPCYACDICGNQVYPTSRTIFHKSTTPLKTWFSIINRMRNTHGQLTAKDVQREYGMTYKTAWRMIHKIRELINEKSSRSAHMAGIRNYHFNSQKIKDGNLQAKEGLRNIEVCDNLYRDIFSNQTSNTTSATYNKPDSNLKKYFRKRDRTARLLKEQILLYQHPHGLDVKEIASRCLVSKRTIYRDFKALESELGIPIWEQGTNRGITEGYFLPPVNFTLQEAVIIFLAARLLENYVYLYNPNFASTFMKLNTIVPAPLKKQIENMLEYFNRKPQKEISFSNLNTLIQAWLSQRQVKIYYQETEDDHPVERMIDPYFIEISVIGCALFILAFCHLKNTIRAFHFERIIGEVIMESGTFEIPVDFNAIEYLSSTWGINFDNEIEVVKLRFKNNIDALTMINRFHPFQSIETQSNDSTILTLKVRDRNNLIYWIMGLGTKVEVLEPQALRKQICNEAKSLLDIYSENKD
ncbi:MAG: WYL domain-containing protein [Dehalococcoidales bacterium]|nr:WYL domain-containing protein [Dehalococcoidales bacterium]